MEAAGQTGVAARLDVAYGIAEDPGPGQIEAKRCFGGQKHAGSRLTPRMIGDVEGRYGVCVVSAGENHIEIGVLLRIPVDEFRLHCRERSPFLTYIAHGHWAEFDEGEVWHNLEAAMARNEPDEDPLFIGFEQQVTTKRRFLGGPPT